MTSDHTLIVKQFDTIIASTANKIESSGRCKWSWGELNLEKKILNQSRDPMQQGPSLYWVDMSSNQ